MRAWSYRTRVFQDGHLAATFVHATARSPGVPTQLCAALLADRGPCLVQMTREGDGVREELAVLWAEVDGPVYVAKRLGRPILRFDLRECTLLALPTRAKARWRVDAEVQASEAF